MTIDMMTDLTKVQTKTSRNQEIGNANKALADEFLEFMKKSPIERLRDQYLKAHNLTEDQLKSMPLEQRQALEDDLSQYIKDQLNLVEDKKNAEKALASSGNGLQVMLAKMQAA
ncbi:MAG TPA: hypothetical protein VN112_07895 [Ensifer sp.]|nr:hypothetical protein [Ensifer sp.]